MHIDRRIIIFAAVGALIIAACLLLYLFFCSDDSDLLDRWLPQRGYLPFVVNIGQADISISYYAHVDGGLVTINADGSITYSMQTYPASGDPGLLRFTELLSDAERIQVLGSRQTSTTVSYYLGNEPGSSTAGVPTCQAVELGQVYDGIHVRLLANRGNVEKVFYIEPGADTQTIKLRVVGCETLSVTDDGELKVCTQHGEMAFTRPVAWQPADSEKRYVSNLSDFASPSSRVTFYLASRKKVGKKTPAIAVVDLKPVQGRKKLTVKMKARIDEAVKPGDYYLAFFIDADNTLADPFRENNMSFSTKKLQIK